MQPTVAAQHFIDAIKKLADIPNDPWQCEEQEIVPGHKHLRIDMRCEKSEIIALFDSILSRVRQEAMEKAIDQCKDIVQGYIESRPYFPLHSVQTRMEELKSKTD